MTTASQAGLQSAIDGSDVIGRWEWDIPNDRLYVGATVALLFSVDPEQAKAGVPLSAFLPGIHPEDRARTVTVIAQSVQAGRSYVQEYRVRSADGVMRWVLARGLIERTGNGQPCRGTGVLIDITQTRASDPAGTSEPSARSDHPLERAAEHCLAAKEAIHRLPDPLLRNMIDMLLLEVGRRLTAGVGDHGRVTMH